MTEAEYMNPFPGLRSFEEDEDYLFFGREKQIDELLKKLRTARFLAVVGASGSGKSSLVKCGLLPGLYGGYMVGAGSGWKVTVFRPGNDPIGNMARNLAEPGVLYEEEEMDMAYAPIIESTLRRSKLGLVEAVRQSKLQPDENLLIVVDQFEELFRFSKYEKQAKEGTRDSLAFINMLLTAAEQTDLPIYIVFTMRSDFLGDCTEFRGLPEAINKGQYLIPRMTREERREAIAGPIAVSGAEISSQLLTRLLNDVGDNPDQLPILQHALMRTWDNWHQNHEEGESIGLKHYQNIGTMSGALSLHADEAYGELENKHDQYICEILFKALTDKGSDSRGIRRPTRLSEICELANAPVEDVVKIIEVFRQPGRSFLMPPVGVELQENDIIDISHESLMRVWEKLMAWVDEEALSAETYLRLAEAGVLYLEGKTGLWRDPELQIALNWEEENQPNATWAQRYHPGFEAAISFLRYSKEKHDAEILAKELAQKKRLRRSRIFLIVVSTMGVIAMFLAGFAFSEKTKADAARNKALIAQLNAEIDGLDARVKAVNANLQEGIADQEKKVATEAQKIAEEAKEDAIKERDNALYQQYQAMLSQRDADVSALEAEILALVADSSSIVAEIQRSLADSLKNETDTTYHIALARNLSAEAIRLIDSGEEEAGVKKALEAYYLNEAFNGPKENNDIYQALHKALRAKGQDYTYDMHSNGVRTLILSDSTKVISGDDDMEIHIIDMSTASGEMQQNKVVKLKERIRSLAHSNDGQFIAAGTFNGGVLLWKKSDLLKKTNTATQGNRLTRNKKAVKLASLREAAPIEDLTFTTVDGVSYLTYIAGDTLRLCKVTNQGCTPIDFIGNRRGIDALAVDAQGKALLVGINDTLYHYPMAKNLAGGKPFSNYVATPMGQSVSCVAMDENLKYTAVGLTNGDLRLMGVMNQQFDTTLISVHKTAITGLDFHHSGNGIQLATSGYDQTAKLISINTIAKGYTGRSNDILTLNGHRKWIYGLAYTTSGYLLTASEDHSVKIWPSSTSVMKQQLETAVDSNMLASAQQSVDAMLGTQDTTVKESTSPGSIDALEVEKSALQEKLEALKKQTVRRPVAPASEIENDRQATREAMVKRSQQLETEIKILEGQLKVLKKEKIDPLQGATEVSEEEINEVRKEMQALEEQINNLKAQKDRLLEDLAKLQ